MEEEVEKMEEHSEKRKGRRREIGGGWTSFSFRVFGFNVTWTYD